MSIFSFSKTEEEKAQLEALDANYAIISFKNDGTILSANQNFTTALGYEFSNEFIGKHHRIFCDTAYTSSNEYQQFWDDLNQGQTQTAEFKRIKKNGDAIFIQASYIPIKDGSGRVTKVIKFAQDITQRKLQSLDYEGQIDAIGKSQAVIEFNMDGTVITANDNFLNTLGYTLGEIQGKHHSMFCEESYKNSSAYPEFWKKLNSGEFDAGEYLRIGKGGKEVWIQASYNPIFDFNGKPFKVVKYATDTTDRKNLIFDIDDNVQKLTSSLTNLSHAAEEMSDGAKVTMDGSESISASITQINQAVVDLSEKIETMLASIRTIAQESSKSERIAQEAQTQSKDTTSSMVQLNEESQKIGETINVITQIAFQTNILSLNAAVEAATAGEAGKGFAVVAQEVRNLASRSDEAAKEITEAITQIQSLVTSSLDSIHTIDKTIEDISSMSSNISDSMKEQENITNILSSTALETSQGVNEITNTMVGVSKSAQNSGVKSQETLDATNDLVTVSNDLINILGNLK